MDRQFKAFISYRHLPLDISTAKRLHKYIEHYTIPKDLRKDGQKHPGLVFRDQDELPLSGNLSESIQTALDHSEFLIVICTPETGKSQWVQREITYFIETHGRDHVLAVLASGDEKTSFPAELTAVTDENGDILKNVEPLAANVVADTEAKRARLLKTEGLRLMAALIGCNYDDLYKREQRYKRRRILIAATAVLLAASAYITTLTVKNRQITEQNLRITEQNEEISQQNEAITEQNLRITEQNAEIAEQLRQTQLNESKNLTALSKIAYEDGDYRSALQYVYDALPAEDPDRPYYPEAEAQLNKILHLYKTDAFVYTQSIEQESNIEGFQVSADGKKAVTVDSSDCIRVFDCLTGEKLWEREIKNPNGFDLNGFQFSEDGRVLVCYTYRDFLFFDSADGTLLREETGQYGSGLLTQSGVYLVQSADRKELQLRDVNSGETMAAVQISAEERGNLNLCFYWELSDSGKTLATICDYYDNEEKTSKYTLLVWDTDSGSAKLIPLEQNLNSGTDARIAFAGEDIALATADMHTSTVMLFERAKDWQMKYQLEIPNEFALSLNNAFVLSASIRLFSVTEDGNILFGADDYICTIDLESGSILAERTLPSSLIFAKATNGGSMLILNNGLLTLYMPDGNLSNDVNLYSFNAEQNVYGGEIRGERPLTATYAMIFKESKNRVSFLHYMDDRDLPHLYDFSNRSQKLNFYVSPNREWMAGIRFDYGSSMLIGVLLDADAGNVSEFSIPMPYDWSCVKQNDVLLSNDGILYMNEYAADLNAKTLTVLDDRAVSTYADYQCKSAFDKNTDTVLTAYLDPYEHEILFSFSDGRETCSYPFPSDLNESETPWSDTFVCECVSSCGNVIVSRRDNRVITEGNLIEKVYLFSLNSETWTELPAEKIHFDDYAPRQLAACSENGKRIALLSNDGGIMILNGDSGKEILHIDCLLPPDAVSQMLFAQGDTILFAFGYSGTMLLYSTETGELLMEQNYRNINLNFRTDARCEAICSADGKKMVLVYDTDIYTESFCTIIDLEQYASLGTYPGIVAYLPESNRLILSPNNGYGLCEIPLYTLEETLALAQTTLNP